MTWRIGALIIFPTSEQYREDHVLRGKSNLKHLSSIVGGEIEAEEGWRDGEWGRRKGVRNGGGAWETTGNWERHN